LSRSMPETTEPHHAIEAHAVLERLEVDRGQGLSVEGVEQRREKHEPNQLREEKRRSAWLIFIDQFKSIVIILLAVAGGAALATARWPEAIALAAVIIVNTLIGFFSEWKAVRSMEALRKLGEHNCRVRRDGVEKEIAAADLVPGDIVLIGAEELAAADMRVLTAEELRVNEAALTGESVPVDKTIQPVEAGAPLAERTCMLYKGTSPTSGQAEAVVVATGMETELGRISQLAQEAESGTVPLQEKLDDLGRRLAWVTIGIVVVVAIAGVLAGREMMQMVEVSIALGAAAIPEGLPIVATIALAHGMYLMAKRNAVVNRLTTVETLGATGIIFTDKTGTLTENRMAVRKIVTPEDEHEFEDHRPKEDCDTENVMLRRVIQNAVLCNSAILGEGEDGDTGDPTEIALLEVGASLGLDRKALLEEAAEELQVAFDPDVMMMGSYHRNTESLSLAVKGAPGAVLEKCVRQTHRDGDSEMTEEDRKRWREQADEMAAQGLRLLAVADRPAESSDEAEPYRDLCFLGLIGMVDPPRKGIREAVEECQRAGIRPIMVTGDRADTGRAIGEQVGLTEKGESIEGGELNDLELLSNEARSRVLKANVFARVTPKQKLELVKLYQNSGEIVAMTGDGVNDAPALKQADIGVAMGKRGTDAAKQVADMVLRDDKFSTIAAAIWQGRVIFANIRKSVVFMLCTNLAEILVVTIASLAYWPIPLLPLQILFLNVLTDVFPGLALGLGRGSREVMDRPPRDPKEPVLTRHHWMAIGGWSFVVGACVLGALNLALLALGFEETQAVTVSFLTLGFAKLWFVFNLRDQKRRILRNEITQNRWIWAALALCTCLLLLAVYFPPLSAVLETQDPGLDGWLLILGMSLVPAILGLFVPTIRFHAQHKPEQSDSS